MSKWEPPTPQKPRWEKDKELNEEDRANALNALVDEYLLHKSNEEFTEFGTSYDPVNRPVHYNTHPSGVEPIEITEHMDFLTGNVIKYVMRSKYKGNELQDLQKARWYLDRKIKQLEDDSL